METKEQVLNAFRLELNKWLNHSVRGMKSGNPAYFQGKITLIHDLLGFIHDIDNQEEPDKSLEEEISRTYHDGSVTDTEDIDHIAYENISRHFAKWGAEHLRDSTKMIDKSLEEAAENIYKVPFGTRAEDFIAGAEWKERQMLKDAVEGTVMDFSSYLPRPQVDILLDPHKYHTGDKVRIVVLKEEE